MYSPAPRTPSAALRHTPSHDYPLAWLACHPAGQHLCGGPMHHTIDVRPALLVHPWCPVCAIHMDSCHQARSRVIRVFQPPLAHFSYQLWALLTHCRQPSTMPSTRNTSKSWKGLIVRTVCMTFTHAVSVVCMHSKCCHLTGVATYLRWPPPVRRHGKLAAGCWLRYVGMFACAYISNIYIQAYIVPGHHSCPVHMYT